MSEKGKLLVENKQIVVPGEVLATGMDYLPGEGTYRNDDKIMANRVGLLSIDGKVLKTIKLAGRYMPKVRDVVIAKVIDILMTGWRVELNSAYSAVLSLKEASSIFIRRGEDLSKYFAIDDYLMCQITQVTGQNIVDVTCRGPGLRKLQGGRVVIVNSNKVPRIIGKQGSMVSMIKQYTGCHISVGQNGLVWVSGEDPNKENVAIETIEKIDKESHIVGLTEHVEDFLKKKTGKKIEKVAEATED